MGGMGAGVGMDAKKDTSANPSVSKTWRSTVSLLRACAQVGIVQGRGGVGQRYHQEGCTACFVPCAAATAPDALCATATIKGTAGLESLIVYPTKQLVGVVTVQTRH